MLPINLCYQCGDPVAEDRYICKECETGRPEPRCKCIFFNDYFCSLTGEDCVKECLDYKEDKICTTVESI